MRELSRTSSPNSFNPYSDSCGRYDRFKAASLRRRILRETLLAAKESTVEAIWVGRDAGYLGCRRTGIPFTDPVNFENHLRYWGINSSLPVKATDRKEGSATEVWRALSTLPNQRVFLWNAFPLHSHKAGLPLSNRQHNATERELGRPFLKDLVELLIPQKLVAIGELAEAQIKRLDTSVEITTHRVRHPSYGGNRKFRVEIENVMTNL